MLDVQEPGPGRVLRPSTYPLLVPLLRDDLGDVVTPAQRAAQAMSEKDLQETVRRICANLGLYCFHVQNSKGCPAGWPDLAIIGRRLIFIELKSQAGTVSAEQAEVGRKLKAAGQSWRIWRPTDLIDGTIGQELAVLAAIQQTLWEESA